MVTVTAKQMHTKLANVFKLVEKEGEIIIIKNSKPMYKISVIANDKKEKKHTMDDFMEAIEKSPKTNTWIDEWEERINALPKTNAPKDLSTTYKQYIY